MESNLFLCLSLFMYHLRIFFLNWSHEMFSILFYKSFIVLPFTLKFYFIQLFCVWYDVFYCVNNQLSSIKLFIEMLTLSPLILNITSDTYQVSKSECLFLVCLCDSIGLLSQLQQLYNSWHTKSFRPILLQVGPPNLSALRFYIHFKTRLPSSTRNK